MLVAQTAVWGVEGQQAKVSGTGLHDRLFSFGSSKDNTQQCRSRTLMEMNPTISGRNTISSPSQLCLPFTSILPFSFHLCRPYFMKIWGEDARGSSGSTALTRLPSKHQDRKGREKPLFLFSSTLTPHPDCCFFQILGVGVGGAEDQWGKTFKRE